MTLWKIDPHEIKYAGAGAKLQWAMAIGIGVDQFVHELARPANDMELLGEIRKRLSSPGVDQSFKSPSALDPVHRKAIDGILHAVGTKLTTDDLHKVFSEQTGGRQHLSSGDRAS